MAENSQEKPKIVVDDDWKTQARAEKERLAEQVEKQASASSGAPAGEGAGSGHELPPADFVGLVGLLHSQAMFALGAVADPRTNQPFLDLDLAKHHIDLLAMLEEKTRGNLTDEEKQVLDRALYDARMHYVQAAQGGIGV